MPIKYSIHLEDLIIEETWTGEVNSTELQSYWRSYLADPEVLMIRRTLVDLREAKILFTGRELNLLIQWEVMPKLNGMNWKSALVVNHPVQYGVSRQYQAFAELYSQDSIFTELATARSWLLKQ